MKYDFKKIEKKWQRLWEEKKPWQAADFNKKKKFYSLVEFPYPSGDGLHVGHVRSYTALDIISRQRRMAGYNVLYPIGWDAFGLPTENYAIKTGTPPAIVTKRNTENFRRQIKSLGLSFDWDREINTTDPNYYRWTQWLFIQFFKHGLAYKDSAYINWCPSCKIGLANEEVVGGRCERCGGLVEKKIKKQWMLRITAYADKLLAGLENVNFLEEIKTQQRNWIGRSEGRLIQFNLSNLGQPITVFTTRPDTIDGATFLVLAPEHALVAELLENGKIKNAAVVKNYIKKTQKKSDLERQENKIKTGVFLDGVKAINPYNNEKLPIWIADYVLIHYGSGAIMAVPAHDERDREFAEKFDLPIKDAPLVAKTKWPGKKQINYKLRDWVFSRQRYWGEPIPIIICQKCGYVPVPDKDLPVVLPEVKNFQPRDDGQSPLASATKWLKTTCPNCGAPAERETDVMPNWAGSSWYFLAYCMPDDVSSLRKGDNHIVDFASKIKTQNSKLKYWLPIDWYNGGMEHVTLHLLYSRFWNIFLNDIGLAPVSEPYQKRTAHGLILGEGGMKMSKSKGNVVNPDDLVKEFGADALRLYEMFIGPFDEAASWNPSGIIGTFRFLNRVYDLARRLAKQSINNNTAGDPDLEQLIHQTIKKITEDIEDMKFNTAISSLMILVNKMEEISVKSSLSQSNLIILLKLLFPFAPHLAQELWSICNLKTVDNPLDFEPWPTYDPKLITQNSFQLVIQINGKTRAVVASKTGLTAKEAKSLALSQKNIEKWLTGNKIHKTIFVPDKLINFILKPTI